MSNLFKSLMLLLSFTLLPGLVFAGIKDPIDSTMKVVDEVLAQASKVNQTASKVQKKTQEVKTGAKSLKDMSVTDSLGGQLWPEKLSMKPTFSKAMSGNIKNTSKLEENIGKEYMAEYGKGNDSIVAKIQDKKNNEIRQNNIAFIYAKALAMRARLAKERTTEVQEVDKTNAIDVIRASRTYAKNITMRMSDILTLEAALMEYDATFKLMSMPENFIAASESGEVPLSGED